MPAGKAYTIPQLYALARKAGFSMQKAVECAAIAMAESSGIPDNTSPNPDGGTNAGLMQLDTPHGLGAGYTVEQLKDPATNMAVAFKTSNGGNDWSKWSSWPAAAKKFIPDAIAANDGEISDPNYVDNLLKDITGAASSAGSAITGAIGQVLSLPSQITDLLTAAEKPIQGLTWFLNPKNWARMIIGILGFLLMGAGLITLIKAAD